MAMPDIYSPDEIRLLIVQREVTLSRYKADLHHLIHPRNRPVDADVRKQHLAQALYLRYSIRLMRRALHALKTNFPET